MTPVKGSFKSPQKIVGGPDPQIENYCNKESYELYTGLGLSYPACQGVSGGGADGTYHWSEQGE